MILVKKFSILALIVALIFGVKSLALAAAAEKSEDRWLIYLYLSGNNLESSPPEGGEPAASEDLQEIANKKFDVAANDATGERFELPRYIDSNIKLPPNVKFLIQTGGCKDWFISEIPHGTIGRYIFDSDGFHYQGALKDADMGDSETLEDFLRYGKNVVEKDFKPTRRMFIFWGHGGLAAVCFDERYGHETIADRESFLDLNEIRSAFSKVFKASPNNPPFEIIGFDACTRATYDNANNIYGFARYMIASEENEPTCGWYYRDWIKAISEKPSISGKRLGTLICKSSYDYIEKELPESASEATFSVVDLSPEKWLPLRKAYNSFYKNYFKAGSENPYIYTTIEAAAIFAEHYNENRSGTNSMPGMMLDLKDFAENIKFNLLPSLNPSTRETLTKSADDLISAIDSAVVYNISGEFRAGSNGLASYYPLSKDAAEFELYAAQDVAFKYSRKLYENLIAMAGTSESAVDDNQNSSATRSGKKSAASNWREFFDLSDLHGLEVKINGKDSASNNSGDDTFEITAELTPEQMQKVSQISSVVVKGFNAANPAFGLSGKGLVYFGARPVKAELVDGSYQLTDELKATWPSLNGHFIFTLVLETRSDKFDTNGKLLRKGYTIYGVPVVLNDRPCLLKVAYFPSEQRYQIIGARPSENKGVGVTTREFLIPEKGDKIAPIFLSMMLTKNHDETALISMDSGNLHVGLGFTVGKAFTLKEEPFVSDMPLADSNSPEDIDYDENLERYYGYAMQFISPRGNVAHSQGVLFEIDEGKIDGAKVQISNPGDNEPITVTIEGEEYIYNPKTGKYFKDGEEYFLDANTGEMVKVEK